jgi:N4-gp56 family major capsid protein
MAFDLTAATFWKDLPSDVKAKIWEKRVTLGATQKNALREFVGAEGSAMPIVRKRDLAKGGAGVVTFNNTVGLRGRGRVGEQELKSATEKLSFGAFSVAVDWLRHAVSWTRKNQSHLPFGGSIPELTSKIMGEWYARKEEDDYTITLRNQALYLTSANLVRMGNRSTQAELLSADLITTSEIERIKGIASSQGAKPMSVMKEGKAEYQRYLLFAPDQYLRPLKSSASYLAALREADARGAENRLFTGKYADWDNNIIYPHNLMLQDDVDGPQGSPLLPVAYLGTAIADGTPTTITGGGTQYPAGGGDYFAYFPGFAWKLTEDEVTPDLSGNTYYACIYNINTDGKYEIIAYSGNENLGGTLVTVTRGSATHTGGVAGGGNVTAQAASRFSLVHPSGAIIFPCTFNGVPLGWSLFLGAEALYHATGMVEAEPIEHWDDFQTPKGEAFLKAFGLQGIRGMTPFKTKGNRVPNHLVVEGAVQIPGVRMEPFAG